MIDKNTLATSSIYQLAQFVEGDWHKVNFAARPYLDAMHGMITIDESYGFDDGRSIVRYFLCNATKWKGDTARAVKAELQARLKR